MPAQKLTCQIKRFFLDFFIFSVVVRKFRGVHYVDNSKQLVDCQSVQQGVFPSVTILGKCQLGNTGAGVKV